MQFITDITKSTMSADLVEAESVNCEFDRIRKENTYAALSSEIDSKFLVFDKLLALKNAVSSGRSDGVFLTCFNYRNELSKLLNMQLVASDTESFNREFQLLSISKIDGALESWASEFVKIMQSLIDAFIDYWMDWWIDNRRYRFQLQTHGVRLQNNLNAYCNGDQRIFSDLTVVTYHNLIWRGMLQAAVNIADTYSAIPQDQENYLKNNRNTLEVNFAKFGLSLTDSGVFNMSGNTGPDRRPYKLGTAQWKLNDLGSFCETTVSLLKDDQNMTKARDAVVKKMKAAQAAAKNPEEAQRLKKESDFFRSVLQKSSDAAGGVARALVLVCSAAKNWKPPTT